MVELNEAGSPEQGEK